MNKWVMKKIKDLAEGLKVEHQWSKKIREELVLKFKYLMPSYHGHATYKENKSYTNLTTFTKAQRVITQSVLDEIAVKTGFEFKMVESTEFSFFPHIQPKLAMR